MTTKDREPQMCVVHPHVLAVVGLGKPCAICSKCLAPKDRKPPKPWGLPAPRTVVLSERSCIHCGGRLAQVLIDIDPDTDEHPCCDITTWLQVLPDYSPTRYVRRA